MAVETAEHLRAYLEYFRDLGVYDFYRGAAEFERASTGDAPALLPEAADPGVALEASILPGGLGAGESATAVHVSFGEPETLASGCGESHMARGGGRLLSFDELAPPVAERIAPERREAALRAVQEEIGDCTRCPLAYGGRRSIVFGDGSPTARLMFVGEGPGADEDASGVPFVGKAGQLLNNMISAMGLRREEVYIANIVKCRPPANRVPEPVEAGTCSPFLLRQMDLVQPEVVVALGATAAQYLLGVKQTLGSLRGQWFSARGAKVAVTYHPAYLLRDPRQKGEAWKDLQRVMAEMGLKGAGRG